MYRRVEALFRTKPIFANAVSGCLAGAIGDGAAQAMELSLSLEDSLSAERWLGTISFQGGASSLVYTPFYKWLDRKFGEARTIRSVGAKVFLDDFLLTPVVEIPLYTAYTSAIEGSNFSQKMKSNYMDVTLAAWCINIPISVINFTLVPPHLRVVVLDIAECVWTCALSYLSHRGDGD